jgi:cytochrome c biogenesis protein CcmG/thiol:disulfide interchange protein DsbE
MPRHGAIIPTWIGIAILIWLARPGWAEDGDKARIGVRFMVMGDGLLVTRVTPGMGADRAGILPGEMIVAGAGVTLGDDSGKARAVLLGPTGSEVEVQVRGAWMGEVRTTRVERGLHPAFEPADLMGDVADMPQVVKDFRLALRTTGVKKVVAATQAMVDADFGGVAPGAAVGTSLRNAHQRRARLAVAATDVLEQSARQDAGLAYRMADIRNRQGDAGRTVDLLERWKAQRQGDLCLGDECADCGGGHYGRRTLIESKIELGRLEEARADLLELERSRDVGELRQQVGLASADEQLVWRAELPPVADFEVSLLDGSTWSLEANRGKAVLINFWATWCGPCKEELPELVTLYEKHGASGLEVLALSVDDAGAGDAVAKMAKKMGLPFSVSHAPQIAEIFDVGAVPAIRLVGRGGAMQYRARGYSPIALNQLEEQIERVLKSDGSGGAAVGTAWGPAEANLLDFWVIAGTYDLNVDSERVVVGVAGASPLVLELQGDVLIESDVSEGRSSGRTRVGWLEGPVGADDGRYWLRAWDEFGTTRWWMNTDGPIEDIEVHDKHLWVATTEGVAVLDAEGQLVATTEVKVDDLRTGGERLFAVDGRQLWELELNSGEVHAKVLAPAPGSYRVGSDGSVGIKIISDIVVGRFGPDGALRHVVARSDGAVVALDGEGRPAFTVQLAGRARIGAADRDGDGHDELFVGIRDQGMAVVGLRLP